MARAFLVIMDSVGIGGAPDADQYFSGDVPDMGANTLGHIRAAKPDLHLPNLSRLGLWHAEALANATPPPDAEAHGLWGAATEESRGKDTPSGHWELAGLPVPWDWHYFPDRVPSFPDDITQAAAKAANTDGILGNCHASGTEIIARLGAQHIQTGWPICYTSADSVFQIAAHEKHFGLERLYEMCRTLAPVLHARKVGRVIARPFVGATGAFERTGNRKDYAIRPPAPILTDWVQRSGGKVYGVGKIGDIFSMQGIDEVVKGPDRELMTHLGKLVETAEPGSLTFVNFVEFDSLYGHRRDIAGYAGHLEWFDAAIGKVSENLREDDILVLTADHGNDPSWVGTDHTRERVPVLVAGGGARSLGLMAFKDVANIVVRHLGIAVA